MWAACRESGQKPGYGLWMMKRVRKLRKRERERKNTCAMYVNGPANGQKEARKRDGAEPACHMMPLLPIKESGFFSILYANHHIGKNEGNYLCTMRKFQIGKMISFI